MYSCKTTPDATILMGNIKVANRRTNAHQSIIFTGHSFWLCSEKTNRRKSKSKFSTTLKENCTISFLVIAIAIW